MKEYLLVELDTYTHTLGTMNDSPAKLYPILARVNPIKEYWVLF